VEYVELPAPPPLDQIVHCFWFLRGTIHDSAPQVIVPDGRLEIVLHLADPFALVDAGGTPQRQQSALAAGQLTAPIQLVARGEADVVGIRFRTAMAASVLRLPLHELTNRVESLSEATPSLVDALSAAAGRFSAPAARVAAPSEVLSRAVGGRPAPLGLEATRVLGSAQPVDVARLARRLGVTTRTLQRRLLDQVGLAPKVLQRVARFRRALRLLGTTPPGAWTRAALSVGYYDQSHLIREFRQFAGASPSEYFAAAAVPLIQHDVLGGVPEHAEQLPPKQDSAPRNDSV